MLLSAILERQLYQSEHFWIQDSIDFPNPNGLGRILAHVTE